MDNNHQFGTRSNLVVQERCTSCFALDNYADPSRAHLSSYATVTLDMLGQERPTALPIL